MRALVANPPVVDMSRYMEAWVGTDVFRMTRDIRPEDVIGVPEDLMPRQMQWGIAAICERFGVPSFHAWRDAIGAYRLGRLARPIRCPVLALVGRPGGARAAGPVRGAGGRGRAARSPRSRFTAEDGASTHCQSDNIRLSAQVTFDWLDDQVAVAGRPTARPPWRPSARAARGDGSRPATGPSRCGPAAATAAWSWTDGGAWLGRPVKPSPCQVAAENW